MRILGFSQIRDMLVRLAPSRLSKEAARALKPDTDEDTVVKSLTDTEEAVVCLEKKGKYLWEELRIFDPFGKG